MISARIAQRRRNDIAPCRSGGRGTRWGVVWNVRTGPVYRRLRRTAEAGPRELIIPGLWVRIPEGPPSKQQVRPRVWPFSLSRSVCNAVQRHLTDGIMEPSDAFRAPGTAVLCMAHGVRFLTRASCIRHQPMDRQSGHLGGGGVRAHVVRVVRLELRVAVQAAHERVL